MCSCGDDDDGDDREENEGRMGVVGGRCSRERGRRREEEDFGLRGRNVLCRWAVGGKWNCLWPRNPRKLGEDAGTLAERQREMAME